MGKPAPSRDRGKRTPRASEPRPQPEGLESGAEALAGEILKDLVGAG